MKAIIRGAPEPMINTNEEVREVDKAQFDELSAKVEALANAKPLTAEDVAGIVANALKPITDAQEARDKADAEKAEAERTALVNKVVEAKILTEDEAKDVPVAALNALLTQPKPYMTVNSAYKPAANKTDRAALAPKGE